MIHKLVFDTSDATSIAQSSNVGAYVRSADGTLVTSTTVGGKEALDVYIAEGINVEVDLDAADDSVAAWLSDGAGNAITSSAGALDVNIASQDIDIAVSDAALANTAIQADAESVSVTGALFSSPLASRKYAYIYNNGNKAIYVGPSGVTTTDGFPVFSGSLLELRVGAAVAVHAIAETGTQNVRTLQLS